MKKKICLFSILFVIIDQILKKVVTMWIPYQEEKEVIPHFFYLTNVHNKGGAWSIFSGNVWVFVLVGIVAVLAIFFFLEKEKSL